MGNQSPKITFPTLEDMTEELLQEAEVVVLCVHQWAVHV